MNTHADTQRRRRIRRSTLLLALVAGGLYVLFIVLSISHAR